MKGLKSKYLFLLLVALGCAEHKETKESEGTDDMASISYANESDIAQVVTKLNNAMVNRDSLQLDALTSANLTYGHSSGLLQDKDAFMEDVLHGPFNFSMINTPGQEIRSMGNTAIVRHVFEARATNQGRPVDIRIGNIQVYLRDTTGKWRLLARQAFKL